MAHVQDGSGQVSFFPTRSLGVGDHPTMQVRRPLHTSEKSECRNQTNPYPMRQFLKTLIFL